MPKSTFLPTRRLHPADHTLLSPCPSEIPRVALFPQFLPYKHRVCEHFEEGSVALLPCGFTDLAAVLGLSCAELDFLQKAGDEGGLVGLKGGSGVANAQCRVHSLGKCYFLAESRVGIKAL